MQIAYAARILFRNTDIAGCRKKSQISLTGLSTFSAHEEELVPVYGQVSGSEIPLDDVTKYGCPDRLFLTSGISHSSGTAEDSHFIPC